MSPTPDSLPTLHAVIAHWAERTPDSPFLVTDEREETFAQCVETTAGVATGLRRQGIRPGDLVLALLASRIDTVRALLGVSMAGGILVPVSRRMALPRLRAIVGCVEPAWVIADPDCGPCLDRLAGWLPPRTRWIPMRGDAGSCSFEELMATPRTAPIPRYGPDDTCYIDFTSGSTGAPKGVPRTYGSIASISHSAISALGLSPNDRHLSLFAPFAHPHEALARAAYLGGTLVCLDTIRPASVSRCVARHRVTCLMAVPTVYGLLARKLNEPRFASVRLMESGGAVTPERLIETYRSRLGLPLTPVYGCTEAGGIALAAPADESRPPGAVGLLCPGFEARLCPEEHGGVEAGESGELVLRGPSLAREYFRNPRESARAFTQGWYHTGDLFSRDVRGFFFFQGRIDDMVKVRGLKVAPTEIERVLLRHPEVEEAAVVGGDDHLVAFVVVRRGSSLSERSLRGFCREHLDAFKVPRIVFRERLPKSESGKILTRNLRGRGYGGG